MVDDGEISDFIVPSHVRRGDFSLAVSTGGKSPALARKVRTRLEKEFGDEYEALVSIIDDVRTEVKRLGMDIDADGWQEALDLDHLTSLLREGEREKARAALNENIKAQKRKGKR